MAHHELTEDNSRMSGNDHDALDEILDSLRIATESFELNPSSEELQCEVCLLTRSAYTEFYSISEWSNAIDEESSRTLRGLFGRILGKLSKSGPYFDSVDKRFQEFESYCRELPLRDTSDTAVTF